MGFVGGYARATAFSGAWRGICFAPCGILLSMCHDIFLQLL